MILDIVTALFFISVIVSCRRVYRIWLFVFASFLVEFYSNIPFGGATLALALGAMVVRKCMNIFNINSKASIFAASIAGIVVHVGTFTIIRFWFIRGDVLEYALRTGIFFSREVFLVSALACFLLGLRYGIYCIRYAFVEEKII